MDYSLTTQGGKNKSTSHSQNSWSSPIYPPSFNNISLIYSTLKRLSLSISMSHGNTTEWPFWKPSKLSRFSVAENNLLCHPSWDILFFCIQKTSARGNSESKNIRETIGFKDFYPKICICLSLSLSVVVDEKKKRKKEDNIATTNVYKTERKREKTKSSPVWFRGNDQTLWPPLPLGTQHKHISAHTPSKALAQYSRCSSFRRWPYWYSFSTTCFEHLRVQSSYFAIVQPLTPVHLFGYHCAAYFQRFKLGFACITYTHSRAHKSAGVPSEWNGGRAANKKNPFGLNKRGWIYSKRFEIS